MRNNCHFGAPSWKKRLLPKHGPRGPPCATRPGSHRGLAGEVTVKAGQRSERGRHEGNKEGPFSSFMVDP